MKKKDLMRSDCLIALEEGDQLAFYCRYYIDTFTSSASTEKEAVYCLLNIGDFIFELHGAGIVSRGLSPDQKAVYFDEEEEVFLIGFKHSCSKEETAPPIWAQVKLFNCEGQRLAWRVHRLQQLLNRCNCAGDVSGGMNFKQQCKSQSMIRDTAKRSASFRTAQKQVKKILQCMILREREWDIAAHISGPLLLCISFDQII